MAGLVDVVMAGDARGVDVTAGTVTETGAGTAVDTAGLSWAVDLAAEQPAKPEHKKATNTGANTPATNDNKTQALHLS